MTSMTTAQRDYLLSLAKASYWSGVADMAKRHGIRLTMRERAGEISKARASELISELKEIAEQK